MKRILSLLLACLCLLTVLSCGRKENKDSRTPPEQSAEQTERTDVLTNVYRGTVMTLPDDWGKSYRYRMAATVPGIDPETGTVTVYAEDGEFRGHILTWSAESGVTGEKEVPFPEGHEYMAGVFDGGIFRYVTARIEGEPPVQDCAELNVSSMDLETGEVSVSANLRPLFSTADMQQFGLNVSSFAVDADGDLWLATPMEILVLTPDFREIAAFADRYNSPMRLTAAPDGKVWLPDGERILVFDKKSLQECRTLTPPERAKKILFAGGGFDFCYASTSGIYGARIEDGTIAAELLMSYPNSGVDGNESSPVGAFGTFSFLLQENNGYTLYRVSEDVDLSSLRVIQAAAAVNLDRTSGTAGFSAQIVEFNKARPDCRVVLKDYSIYNTEENPDGGTQKLVTDMLTGIYRPDVVFFATRGGYNSAESAAVAEQIVKRGLYRDLSPFLETDERINRETVFGALQRFFSTEDGGMWGIAPVFIMETLIARTDLLEKYAGGAKTGWTLAEFLDFAEALPDGIYLMGSLNRQTAEKFILGPDGYVAFLDFASGTASFDGPLFLRWLRFLLTLPEDFESARKTSPVADGQRVDSIGYYYGGKVALEHKNVLNGFFDYAEWEETFATKDFTVIGFPAEGRSGTPVRCDAAMTITKWCSDPDLAWELIRELMTESWGTMGSCPTLRDKSREYCAQFLDHGQYSVICYSGKNRVGSFGYAENGEFPKREDLGSPGWVCVPSWEDYGRYTELLDTECGYPMTESIPADVAAIVREEISALSAGVGTPEDCAKKIQSRVSIWLAEHN